MSHHASLNRKRAPRLKKLAEMIEASGKFKTRLAQGFCNTDRKIPGTRLRHPGKGRYGTELFVYDLKGNQVFRHNSAETYRTNGEVVRWMEKNGIKGLDKEWPRY